MKENNIDEIETTYYAINNYEQRKIGKLLESLEIHPRVKSNIIFVDVKVKIHYFEEQEGEGK